MVSHKHALERAQKVVPTRADERREKELSVTTKFKEIQKGAGFLNPEKLSPPLVILTFRCFARTTPIGRTKRSQLTDHRAIEKGVETKELIKQRFKLIALSTQVRLHLLNFRADNPNDWEVTKFLPDRVLNWRLFNPRVMVQNPRAEERN